MPNLLNSYKFKGNNIHYRRINIEGIRYDVWVNDEYIGEYPSFQDIIAKIKKLQEEGFIA